MIRALAIAMLAAQWFGGAERNTREGAEHFTAGRLEEALRAFARARAEHPDAPATDLNLAGVQYRLGEEAGGGAPASRGADGSPLAEAARGYQGAISSGLDDGLARDAWFNLGNTLYRAGAFAESAAAYAEALAVDPEDAEARRNLERALLRAEEQRDQQEQQQDGQPSGDDEQDGAPEEPDRPPEEPDPSGEQEQDPSEEQGASEPEEGRSPEAPESGQDPSPESADADAPSGADSPAAGDPGEVPEVSPEQAERILAALAEVERAFQQDQLEKRRARALRRGRH